MKEEDELLKKCGTKNPFMVPEGYFDNFSKELMNKLPEKEQTSTPQETKLLGNVSSLGYIWQLCFVD